MFTKRSGEAQGVAKECSKLYPAFFNTEGLWNAVDGAAGQKMSRCRGELRNTPIGEGCFELRPPVISSHTN